MLRALASRAGGRWAWILPVVLAAYLLMTQGKAYDGFPYWFCIAAPVVAVFGPWMIAWVLRAGRAGGTAPTAGRVLVAAASAIGLLTVAVAIPLELVPHDYIHRTIKVALVVAVVGLAGAGAISGWRQGRGPRPVHVLLVMAVAVMVEADLRMVAYGLMRDLGLYLRAGQSFLDGNTVYVLNTPADFARDPTLYPFVYPPVTIPFFAGLAALPITIVKGLWLVMCLAASVAALRIIGVRWRWLPVLLLWPPFVQGISVGNAVVPAFLFFAAAPRFGALLAVPPMFKTQLGIPGLWLVRERRWRDLALAVAIGLALILVTLPFVGVSLWGAWLRQLSDFSNLVGQNQTIMGMSLTRSFGPLLAGAIGVAAVLAALTRRRGDGLAGLGVASLAVSPTLYPHGVTMGLPAMLRLRAPLLWFAFALASTLATPQNSSDGYWVALALGFAALWFPALTHAEAPDAVHHPLGSHEQAWPGRFD